MRIAVRMSDGHGNDYADGCGADWAVAELPTIAIGIAQQRAKELNAELGGLLDEIRILSEFDAYNDSLVYNDEGEYATVFSQELEEKDFVVVPDDWISTAEMHSGQVECCSIAVDHHGHLQLHCLPVGLDGWLQSNPFKVEQAGNCDACGNGPAVKTITPPSHGPLISSVPPKPLNVCSSCAKSYEAICCE